MRLASNKFSQIPLVLELIPCLSWTSLANNPFSLQSTLQKVKPIIADTDIVVDPNSMLTGEMENILICLSLASLGSGASGNVYKVIRDGENVAAKLFKGIKYR